MNSATIRVAIADDQPLIRQGLSYIINAQEDMCIVGDAGSGREAVSLASRTKPHVLLMDVQMPECSGIDATREIAALEPDCKVVILTTFDFEKYVFDSIRSGAVGYLLKDADPAELIDTIRSAHRGEAIFRTGIAAKAIAQAVQTAIPSYASGAADIHIIETITDREMEVLQQMAYGLRNEEIAAKLHISESTVKTHVHRILQKFGVEDRTQAVVYAIRNRIVS